MNKQKNPQNEFLKQAYKIRTSGATYDKYGFLEIIAEEIRDKSLSTNKKIMHVNNRGVVADLEYFTPFYVNQFGEASKKINEVCYE